MGTVAPCTEGNRRIEASSQSLYYLYSLQDGDSCVGPAVYQERGNNVHDRPQGH